VRVLLVGRKNAVVMLWKLLSSKLVTMFCVYKGKGKAVPLHAMKALGGRGDI
jgi:hypothetical protein